MSGFGRARKNANFLARSFSLALVLLQLTLDITKAAASLTGGALKFYCLDAISILITNMKVKACLSLRRTDNLMLCLHVT